MRKIFYILILLFSYFSFDFYFESFAKEHKWEYYSKVFGVSDKEFAASISFKIEHDEVDDFIKTSITLAKKYDAILIYGNLVEVAETEIKYVAINQQELDEKLAIIKSDSIDFYDLYEGGYYTLQKNIDADGIVFMFKNENIMIKPFNQIIKDEEAINEYLFFSKSKETYDAFKKSMKDMYGSQISINENWSQTPVDISDRSPYQMTYFIMISIMVTITMFADFIHREKEIKTRNIFGQKTFTIVNSISLKMLINSSLLYLFSIFCLAVLYQLPINQYSYSFYKYMSYTWVVFNLALLVGYGSLILFASKLSFIGNENKKLNVLLNINLTILTLFVMLFINGQFNNVKLIFDGLHEIKIHKYFVSEFKDYNLFYQIYQNEKIDNENLVNFRKYLDNNGMLQIPRYSFSLKKKEDGVENILIYSTNKYIPVYTVNLNYYNNFFIKDSTGNQIEILDDNKTTIIFPSSVKVLNTQKMYLKMGYVNGTDFVESQSFSVITTDFVSLLKYRNCTKESVLIVETEQSNMIVNLPDNYNFTLYSESELNKLAKDFGLNITIITRSVKEASMSRIEAYKPYIMSLALEIVKYLAVTCLLVYQFTEFYLKINQKEIAIRNLHGQGFYQVHKNLIAQFIIILIPVTILLFYNRPLLQDVSCSIFFTILIIYFGTIFIMIKRNDFNINLKGEDI